MPHVDYKSCDVIGLSLTGEIVPLPPRSFKFSLSVHICGRLLELVASNERSVMRAGTISWIVIPFLLASLAASGLGKPHYNGSETDNGFHQSYRCDLRLSTSGTPDLEFQDAAHDESKKSTCLYNLPNETCSESLYCVITEPARPNDNPVQRDCWNQAIILSVKNRTKCLQTCLNDTAVIFTQCGNLTYRFHPIDSPCNTKEEIVVEDLCDLLGGYKYLIAGALGILSLLILIFSVVAKKRKTSATKNDESAESGYEYACNLRSPSEQPKKCEYDYVYGHRRLPEEPKKPEYDDVSGHQQLPEEPMKPEYDDVGDPRRLPMEPTKSEYDYVYSHRL